MKELQQSYGYFHITFRAEGAATLMRSNSERAFIIAQLQYFLSPRLILGEIPAYKQLASCIDLLSFSIKNSAIELLIFSIDLKLCRYFASCITEQFYQYRSEQNPSSAIVAKLKVRTTIRELTGPHQALATSLALHLRHEDWEYDRYSSIGFYLHDRRGDWMRTWRLAQLYENKPEYYLGLIHNRLNGDLAISSVDSQYLAQ